MQLSFNELVGLTFYDGAVHVRHLQMLFKMLVTHLKLDNVQVRFDDQSSLACASNVKLSKESNGVLSVKSVAKPYASVDPVAKVVPTAENLMTNVCDASSNPLVDMLDLLNLTKRVEAIEVSFNKLSSLTESLMKNQSDINQNIMELSERDQPASPVQEIIETVESVTRSSSRVSSENFELKSSAVSLATSCESPKPLSHDEIKGIVKLQMDEAMKLFVGKFNGIDQKVCEFQKSLNEFQSLMEDVMFANEQNDLKIDETLREINDFNSKIFCLKVDVKTLLQSSDDFRKKIEDIDMKYETMNNVKTSKSYVDELFRQKAFKSDLEKFVTYEDFDPIRDILCLKLSLVEENLSKLELSLKKRLACFKFEIDGKLNKEDLCKFKSNVATFFKSFLNDLKALLLELMKSSIGSGTSTQLLSDLNCISCETKVGMMKSEISIPRLKSMSARFKNKLDKSCPRQSPRSDYRILLGEDKVIQKPQHPICVETGKLLNFPNSQQCFIISKDNTIVRADPLKCLNNARYSQA